MYPHERSLVERLSDQPFALLGVNSDEDTEELIEILREEDINWRSWWDGSTTGPIQTQWQVNKRPTIHILDWDGVLRYADIEATEIDAAVDELLAELAAQPKD